MILRAATGEDADAIAALEQSLFGLDAWSLASVVEEVTGHGRHAVVAVTDDELLGYAVTLRVGDLVDLQRIGVDPRRRRQGIARGLLGEVLDRAAGDGAERMLLEVSARNTAALAFYTAERFEEIDRRRRYYRDGSDALVLSRSLTRRG